MKDKLNLLLWVLGLLIIASCGTPDPKELAKQYNEMQMEIMELAIEKQDLEQDLIRTHEKKLKKKKNPKYEEDENEDKYIYVEVVDDWDEHVDLKNNIEDIDKEIDEIRRSFYIELMDAWLSCEDQDEADEWLEDYEDEIEDLEDKSEFEDLEEDLKKEEKRTEEKQESYFTYDD
tara:strand:- start:768 stop:1292 length:525 start_codon:yes stop_codon:yes gene_type:complete